MDFRRSGQLDERRRRVLRDELAQPAQTETADATPTGGGSAKGPVRAYAAEVLSERQLRVIDLLPVRPLWVAVSILLAVTAVAAILCVHIHARTIDLGRNATEGIPYGAFLAALDASQRGSLAAWLASVVLAGGAAASLVTFGIRLHRVDDYRGRYRVWLWTAAALVFASLDAATGMHDAIGLGLATLAGQTTTGGSLVSAVAISWLTLYGLVFGTLAIRLAIEVWCSLPAIAVLAVAGLLYLLAGLGVLELLPASGPLVGSVVQTGLTLLAHVLLVWSVALYARHVVLDATGRLKVHIDPDKKRGVKKPRARLKVVKADKDEVSDSDVSAAGAAAQKQSNGSGPKFGGASNSQPKAGAAIGRPATAASSADYEDEEDDEDEGEGYGGERLSRAERRRLKKLARRDGQRRAA